jgi:hypothetical protein
MTAPIVEACRITAVRVGHSRTQRRYARYDPTSLRPFVFRVPGTPLSRRDFRRTLRATWMGDLLKKSELAFAVAFTIALTVGFTVETAADWPDVIQLHKFELIKENLFNEIF